MGWKKKTQIGRDEWRKCAIKWKTKMKKIKMDQYSIEKRKSEKWQLWKPDHSWEKSIEMAKKNLKMIEVEQNTKILFRYWANILVVIFIY